MKTVNVVAAIICDDYKRKTKIFATQRGYGDYKDGWEFPGGKIEEGETPEEALVREIREELGAEIEVHDLIDIIDYDYETFHLHMNCYWATVAEGKLQLLEHEAAKWLEVSDLRSVDWLPADLDLLPKLAEAMVDKNVEYYDENADSFFAGSVNADMSYERDRFVALLPEHGHVLDAGCGSGRDSKAFMDAGFSVTAFDASKEMRKRASEYLGQEVLDMRFEDINFNNEFDGVWACASLLHVPVDQLPQTMRKLNASLKSGGVIYASFKYGDGTKMRGSRTFSDFNEKSIVPLFEDAGFEILFNESGNDNRPGRADEMWVNAIARKNGIY
nr:NUDIX domain-containing protein [Butyrivibrio sp. XPD2002]